MTTATGLLRYGPTAASVDREPWWVILDCGHDWFRLYNQWMTDHSDARWARVIDPDRIFRGQDVDLSPRLALLRPEYESPAWGPHISVMRGEKPRKNLDLWLNQRDIGDGEWELAKAPARLAEMTERLDLLRDQLAGASSKKARSLQDQIKGVENKIRKHRSWEQRARKKLKASLRQKDALRTRLPERFYSGSEVPFDYDPVPRTKAFLHHWWLSVQSDFLGDFREFYGLNPAPRVPFHLTLGIEAGKTG